MVYGAGYIDIRILQPVVFGNPLALGLGARMQDPYVYVVFWAPKVKTAWKAGGLYLFNGQRATLGGYRGLLLWATWLSR